MGNLICDEKEFSLLEKIHIMLTCFIISWFNNGIVIQILGAKAIMFFAVFGFWFIVSCYFNKYFLWTFLKKAKWLLVFSIIVLIYSINLNVFWNKQSYNALYLPMIYSIGVFFSNEKYDRYKKIIMIYFLCECIIICLKSIYVLNIDEQYARTVTGGGEAVYALVVGYAAVFAFMAMTIFLLNIRGNIDKKYRLLVYVFIISSIVTAYMANYAIAVFLGLAFILFSIVSKKKWSMFFCILICILSVIWLSTYLTDVFLWMSKQNISEHLQGKAYQVAMTLKGKSVNFNTLDARIEYMKNSWKVFKQAPLIGIYGRQELMSNYNHLLRDHNVWIDMLGHYGILRSIPMILFYVSWYKDIVKNKAKPYSYAVFCATMFCFVSGFFDPLNKSIVQLIVFVIIPMSNVLLADKKQKMEKRERYNVKLLEKDFNDIIGEDNFEKDNFI